MKTQIVVWMPFGDLMHNEREPGGKVWSSCIGREAWWHERAHTLRQWTIPSLRHQINQDFLIVGGIAKETPKAYEIPVYKQLVDAGGRVYRHSAYETLDRGQCPPSSFVRFMFDTVKECEYLCLFWMDSDDAISMDMTTMLRNIQAEDGLTAIMRRGYAIDVFSRRVFVYDPEKCPPPFFARWYKRDAFLADPEHYETTRQFRLFHHEMLRVKHRIVIPDFKYLVTLHCTNTSSTLRSEKTRCKLKSEVAVEDRDAVLASFGIG